MIRDDANSELIVERMLNVRESGQAFAMHIPEEAKRLVDWKEHVKARPIVAISLFSLAGFLVVRSLSKGSGHARLPAKAEIQSVASPPTRNAASNQWTAPLVQSAKELATVAAKNLLSAAIKKYMVEGLSHDRLSCRAKTATSASEARQRDIATGVWLD